jgi:hypothetical protein
MCSFPIKYKPGFADVNVANLVQFPNKSQDAIEALGPRRHLKKEAYQRKPHQEF